MDVDQRSETDGRVSVAAVSRLSFFVELPFDVGLPDNTTWTLVEDAAPFAGWEDVPFTPVPWLPAAPQKGVRPMTSFLIRRGTVPSTDPLAATDKTFGVVIRGSESLTARVRRWLRRLDVRPSLPSETRAVVEMTRIVGPAEGAGEEWLSNQFDAGLRRLNEFL